MGNDDLPPTLLDPTGLLDTVVESQSQIQYYVDLTSKVDSKLDGGTDPNYVTTEDAFRSMTHQQIYAAVQALDPSKIASLQDIWLKFSSLAGTFQMHGAFLRNATTDKWEGAAAGAAQAASQRFAQAGDEFGKIATSVTNRLEAAYYSAMALQAVVPAPVVPSTPDPDNSNQSVLPNLTNGEQARADSDAAAQARLAAIAAMETTYNPNIPPTGNSVPAFVPPPQTPSDDPSINGVTNPSNANTSNEAPAPPQNANPNTEDTGAPADSESPAEAGLPTIPGVTSPEPGDPAATTPAGATTAASTNAPVANVPSTSGPSLNSPGINAPGPGSPGQLSMPGPGTSQPAMPTTGAPVLGAAGGTSGSGSRAMTGPMGGAPMGARPGGRNKEDDENTHAIPDYLIGQQSEWTEGLDTPVGVIGESLTMIHEPRETDFFSTEPTVSASTAPVNLEPVAPPAGAASSRYSYEPPTSGEQPAAEVTTTVASSANASPTEGDRPDTTTVPSASDTTASAEVDTSEFYDPDLVVEQSSADDPDKPQTITISGVGPLMDDPDDTPNTRG